MYVKNINQIMIDKHFFVKFNREFDLNNNENFTMMFLDVLKNMMKY